MALEEKKDPQPPRDWLVAFGKGIRTPSLQQGINFSSTQLDVMLRVIKKFDEYDGLILKAYMGAGKTFMSMAIMNYMRETLGDKRGIVVICPDKLVAQWQTDWMSEGGEPQSYKSHNSIWSFTDWVEWSSRHQPTAQSSRRSSFSGSGQADEGSDAEPLGSISADESSPVERLYVFDECHKIRTLTLPLPDEDAENVCKFLCRNGTKRLGLTGTLIYYDRDDLLYEVNALAGTDREGKWALPFTWMHLTNVYRDTEGDTYGVWYALRSIFGGWIFNLDRLHVYPIPNFIKLADIGDFWLNQYGPYVDPKREIVSKLAKSIPGFDTSILVPDWRNLVWKGPMTVISIIAFTSMMNPFSYLIPTIFKLVQIENQNAFNELDKEAIQSKVCGMIVDVPNLDVDERTSFVSDLAGRVGWLADKKDAAVGKVSAFVGRKPENAPEQKYECKETVYKWAGIKRFKNEQGISQEPDLGLHDVFITACHRFEEVDYTWEQLQLFVRFTNDRLTTKDAELLGIKESKRTMTRQLTMRDLETTGLKIGSVQFSDAILEEIKRGVDKRASEFRTTLRKLEGIPPSQEQTPQPDAPSPDAKYGVLKFDMAIKKMMQAKDNRVVVFSQFPEVLKSFEDYANAYRGQFHFFHPSDDKNSKHEFNNTARKYVLQNNSSKLVFMLSAEEADGFDGLEDVGTMIILEPCATDSMKRQLIARVVRQGAHSKSRRVNIFEYVCTPGFANIKRVGASMMDWWKNDKRVAYWVFEPLLDNTRTPDQVVVKNQQVSGEMENLCTNSDKSDFKKGVHNKVKKALPNVGKDFRESFWGSYNFDLIKHEREELRAKIKQTNKYADRIRLARTTSLLNSELKKLKADGKDVSAIEAELSAF
jgi:hypothetical protein